MRSSTVRKGGPLLIHANILIVARYAGYRKDIERQEYAEEPFHCHKGITLIHAIGLQKWAFFEIVNRRPP